jgi:hypothetical protein
MIDIGKNFARIHAPIILSFGQSMWGTRPETGRLVRVPPKEIVLVHQARRTGKGWCFDVWFDTMHIKNIHLHDNEYIKVF